QLPKPKIQEGRKGTRRRRGGNDRADQHGPRRRTTRGRLRLESRQAGIVRVRRVRSGGSCRDRHETGSVSM
ncbi:hypothetical protein HKX48_008337, partial [Thoreauomyces humboldtii]